MLDTAEELVEFGAREGADTTPSGRAGRGDAVFLLEFLHGGTCQRSEERGFVSGRADTVCRHTRRRIGIQYALQRADIFSARAER